MAVGEEEEEDKDGRGKKKRFKMKIEQCYRYNIFTIILQQY